MPPVRSLASKHRTYIVVMILLFSEIMPIYSYYTKKKLIYVIIIAPFSYQPSFYSKCTKLNMRLSYDIQSASDIEYVFLFILSLSYPNSSITWQYTALLAYYYIL